MSTPSREPAARAATSWHCRALRSQPYDVAGRCRRFGAGHGWLRQLSPQTMGDRVSFRSLWRATEPAPHPPVAVLPGRRSPGGAPRGDAPREALPWPGRRSSWSGMRSIIGRLRHQCNATQVAISASVVRTLTQTPPVNEIRMLEFTLTARKPLVKGQVAAEVAAQSWESGQSRGHSCQDPTTPDDNPFIEPPTFPI